MPGPLLDGGRGRTGVAELDEALDGGIEDARPGLGGARLLGASERDATRRNRTDSGSHLTNRTVGPYLVKPIRGASPASPSALARKDAIASRATVAPGQ
jgi:hypothetical protein